MTPLLLTTIAGCGVYLLYTSKSPVARSGASRKALLDPLRSQFDDRLAQAGLAGVEKQKICTVIAVLFIIGLIFGWLLFGGIIAPIALGAFAASFPVASYRQRRQRHRSEAADAWPRMIEEIRLRCGSLGQPIPQALIEVGKNGPVELRAAFIEAEREWLLSTNFTKTVTVLKHQLADPTADATCETLLVALSIGGSDVEQRLAALVEDRRADVHGRKDARAKQAGVRFARRFVLVVPVGMALVGLSIGNGREAYESANGQVGVTIGLATLACCWWWAGRLIQLPEEQRVFRG